MAVSTDRDKSGADDSVNRELVDRYRQASAELDERPSASARASILAAAAREVGARPVDAAAPRRIRPRWPLAAAAAVMLSTLAVMLAIRTNEEMPQFSAPPEAARSGADNVATPASSAPAAEQSISKREVKDQQAPAQREMKNRQAPDSRPARTQERSEAFARSKSDSVAQAPREADRPALAKVTEGAAGSELERARQNAPAASPAPSPAPEPTVGSKQRAEKPAALGAVAQTPMDQASSDARRDAAQPAAPAPLAAAQSERKQTDESAAAWLERIIKLRREARHDEADAELKRFRERYPHVQPPAEALSLTPPAGTR